MHPSALIGHPAAKPVVALASALPLVYLVAAVVLERLGPNPAEALIRSSGDWTLRFLCFTLAVTPLRLATGWHVLARFRRMLGLFTAFYALVHALSYVAFDMAFDLPAVGIDVIKRPFIAVGMTAFVLLAALAATSTSAAVRHLGALRWQRLHRSVYAIAILAILHFFWMRAGKQDFAEVGAYAAMVGGLLSFRLAKRRIRR